MARRNQRWIGPVCLIAGAGMLAAQWYVYQNAGILFSWLIGGGVGFVLVGAAQWLHYLEDMGAASWPSAAEELPTADEYDLQLKETESAESDPESSTLESS